LNMFFSSRRRHTRFSRDWSSDVCSSDLQGFEVAQARLGGGRVHHAMRTVGKCQRAFDMMAERALSRTTQGETLARKQLVQQFIRSEERRVGKECRYGCAVFHEKEKERGR